jgi:serine/threonine protein kinase
MLLDERGYIIVVDFGFAKKVYDKTYTLCGTTDYLAPEVIQHKGHNAAFDWWTLGIFIYELISGKTPFQADSAPAAYQNILTGPLYFPPVFNQAARDLVKCLLHKNPNKRLGMGANGESKCSEIQRHQWFAGFDFKAMLARELPSPHKPEWHSNTDTANFDKYDERDLPPPPSDFVDKDPGWDADF